MPVKTIDMKLYLVKDSLPFANKNASITPFNPKNIRRAI